MNRLRGRERSDTFPTRYRANTPRDLRRLAFSTGFSVDAIDLLEGRPEYLRITPPTYLVGWMYERLVNSVPWLAIFRVVILAEFRKGDQPGDVPGPEVVGDSQPDSASR